MKLAKKIMTIFSYLAVAINAGVCGQPFWVCFVVFTALMSLEGIWNELSEINERERVR